VARDAGGELLRWGFDGGRLLRARVGRGEGAWTAVGHYEAEGGAQPAVLAVDGDGPQPATLHVAGNRPSSRGVTSSGDAGRTWTADAAAGFGGVLHLSLAHHADGAPVLFASTADDGVQVKHGAGAFSASRAGFREPTHQTEQHWLATLPSPDFARDRTVYAATFEGLYVSRDAGTTWRWLNLLHAPLIRNLAFSPRFAQDGRLWVQTYGAGLVASEDRGRSFRRIETMDWWFPDGLAVSPDYDRDATLLIGTPNRLLISRDGGRSVQVALSAKGFSRVLAFAPDWAASGAAYAHLSTDTGLDTNRFVATTDRGRTWRDSSLRTVFDVAFATDFAQSGRLWAGTPDGLFRSDDRGEHFKRVATLTVAGINSVALAPGPVGADGTSGPDVLAVVSRGSGVHLSRDGGATWERPGSGLDGVRVAFVELSPGYAEDGLAFAGPMNSGVHVTRDGGRSWARVPGGPSLVLSMAISPTFGQDRSLLVGAYDGPWLGREAGTAWERLTIPLPEGGTPAVSHEGTPDGGTPAVSHEGPPEGVREEGRGGGPGLVVIVGVAGIVLAGLAVLLVGRRKLSR
jgi:photosystem II stability/assembly factor-like uncharacterized protein